jgi:hypothetical protein
MGHGLNPNRAGLTRGSTEACYASSGFVLIVKSLRAFHDGGGVADVVIGASPLGGF